MFAMTTTRGVALLLAVSAVVLGAPNVRGDEPKERKDAPAGEVLDPTAPCLTTVRLRQPGPVSAAAFLPDGKKLLTVGGGKGGTIRAWDPATGKLLSEWPAEAVGTSALGVASSPKAPLIVASALQNRIAIWDGKTQTVLGRIQARTGTIYSLQVSDDGKMIAVDSLAAPTTHPCRVFDVGTRKEVQIVPEGVPGRVIAVAPDFKKFLVIGGPVQLWEGGRDKVVAQQIADGVAPEHLRQGDAAKGRLLQEFPLSGTMIRSASFSADGKTLLILDTDVKLVAWDTTTGKELRKWERGQTNFFLRAALSPDGRRVAAIERPGVGAVWDLATGWQLLEFRVTPVGGMPLAFSPDGRMLAVGMGDSTVQVHHIPPGRDRLTAKDLDELWTLLAGQDGQAPAAHRAVFVLAYAPRDAVPFLRERLRPAAPADPGKVKKLIADLDADTFTTREAAFEELLKLGTAAEAGLREARKGKPSAEVRLRIDSLLTLAEASGWGRATRALRALELIDNEEARKALAALAGDKGDPALAREAQAALDRLAPRPGKK